MAQVKIQNRWDVYNVLIVEPETNFNNMMLDLMLSNLTTHFETILNNAECEPDKRGIPNFMKQQKRVQRSIFGSALKKFLKKTGKFIAWGAVFTSAGVIGSGSGVWLEHYLSREDYNFVIEQQSKCNFFNSGCHENLCWANCGTRKSSSDWCFTKNANENSTQMTLFGIVNNAKLCQFNRQCDSCAECASECFSDDQMW